MTWVNKINNTSLLSSSGLKVWIQHQSQNIFYQLKYVVTSKKVTNHCRDDGLLTAMEFFSDEFFFFDNYFKTTSGELLVIQT